MRLDVLFSPAGLASHEVAGKSVFVIDILRSSTVVVAALFRGARAVVPVATVEEATRLGQSLGPGAAVLVGERNGAPIEGFDLDNSPAAMTEQRVRGKTVIMTTTNGTPALLAAQAAGEVFVAAAANLTVAAERARAILGRRGDLVVLCSGTEGRFSLDDAYTAGRLVVMALESGRRRKGLNDAALVVVDLARRYGSEWEKALTRSEAGRRLVRSGRGDDLAEAARQDSCPVLPVFRDRRIVTEAA